jgi:hypothetical protein
MFCDQALSAASLIVPFGKRVVVTPEELNWPPRRETTSPERTYSIS